MYIRTKDKIIEVAVISNEKTEKEIIDLLMEKYNGVAYSENKEDLCDLFIRIEKDGTRTFIDKRLLDLGIDIALEFKLKMYGAIWIDDGMRYVLELTNDRTFKLREGQNGTN